MNFCFCLFQPQSRKYQPYFVSSVGGLATPWQKCTLSQLIFTAISFRMGEVTVGPSVLLTGCQRDQEDRPSVVRGQITHGTARSSDGIVMMLVIIWWVSNVGIRCNGNPVHYTDILMIEITLCCGSCSDRLIFLRLIRGGGGSSFLTLWALMMLSNWLR